MCEPFWGSSERAIKALTKLFLFIQVKMVWAKDLSSGGSRAWLPVVLLALSTLFWPLVSWLLFE